MYCPDCSYSKSSLCIFGRVFANLFETKMMKAFIFPFAVSTGGGLPSRDAFIDGIWMSET